MSAKSLPLRLLSVLASGVSLFALGYTQPAIAQQAAQPAAQPEAAGGNGLEEIVVTARRKEEKAQTVPITLVTQNAESLEEMHFASIQELITKTPGLSQANDAANSSYLFIRGVGNVAEYFDDVPAIFPPYPGYAMGLDLGAVQVLKGPQGTLFGQSAGAGAITYASAPTTNDFSGRVEAEAGDYGHKHLEAVLNVPIVDDKVVVRVAGLYQHLDGFLKDVTSGVETGGQDFDIYRATVTLRPTDNFQNDFVFHYFYTDAYPQFTKQWYVNPSTTKLQYDGTTSNSPILSYGPLVLQANAIQLDMGRYNFFGGAYRPGGEYSSGNRYFLVDTARLDITDDITVKNILGYDELLPGPSNAPSAVTPAIWYPLSAATTAQMVAHPLVAGPMTVQYTDEIQVQGKALDDKLGFTAGSFNLIGGTRQPTQGPVYSVSSNLTGGAVSGSASWGRHSSEGLYAQGTYDLGAITEGLSFTLGGRYTWDQEYAFAAAFNGAGVETVNASGYETSKKPSYLVSLDYQLDPTTLLYVSDAKASDKGGFPNGLTSVAFTAPQYAVFTPDSITEYELGIKSDWEAFGIKTRTNLALFYGDYVGQQIVANAAAPSPIPGVPPAQITVTQNAQASHIEGFDMDITLVPTDDLTFSGSIDYTHFQFDKFINAGYTVNNDWSNANVLYQPQLTFTWTLNYKLPVLDWVAPGQDVGTMTYTLNMYRQNHMWGSTNYPTVIENMVPTFAVVNMDVSWKNMLGNDGLDGRVYVQNLFNNYWYTNAGSNYPVSGTTGVDVYPPRTWGFSVSKKF